MVAGAMVVVEVAIERDENHHCCDTHFGRLSLASVRFSTTAYCCRQT
jgi:hypothetical protein